MKRLAIYFCALLIVAPALVSIAQAQSRQVLQPSEHCRDFSASAIVTLADPDLEEVIRAALGLDTLEDLTCGAASQLTELLIPTEIERVVYGGTLRPSPQNPIENLEGIQNFSQLTSLSIINRLLRDIEPLEQLTNLRVLNLHTNWITDITPLGGLTKLESLIISENPIEDITPLKALVKLTRLQVHGLYPFQLNYYLSMDDGREPNVVFNSISDIRPLSGLTELRHLRIHLQNISDITPLSELTELTHLRAFDNKITDIGPLQRLNKMKLLWIHDNLISDIGALRGMTDMVQLGLSDNSITDISALGEMSDIEFMFLSNNQIEDISPLGRLGNLAVLRLENNVISDVTPLRTLTNLRELGLAHNDQLYDVQPLLANEGIGPGDELDLRFTNTPCSAMSAFETKGVMMLRVTSLNGSACPGRRLTDPR